MTGMMLVLALAALLAAIAFFMQSRTARAEAAKLAGRIDAAVAEAAAATKALGEQRGELKERREEAISLRQKLDEAKKKAFEQAEAQKRLGGAGGLREELDKLAARLAEARAEAAHQVELAKAAEGTRARAVAEAERLKVALERKEAAPAPVVKPPPAEGSELAEALKKVEEAGAKVVAETERADKAEARAGELRKKLSEVEKDLKAARGKAETDRRVFIVQKGELDVAHDRYAELKRRNDQLRREHDELIDAVRQAAREEKAAAEAKAAPTPAPPPNPVPE